MHEIRLRTATEELGGPRRFTRVRCTLRPSRRFGGIVALLGLWTALAPFAALRWPLVVAGAGWAALGAWVLLSRFRCRRAVTRLVFRAGIDAGLEPAPVRAPRAQLAPVSDAPVQGSVDLDPEASYT
jgi:hypothetical protein